MDTFFHQRGDRTAPRPPAQNQQKGKRDSKKAKENSAFKGRERSPILKTRGENKCEGGGKLGKENALCSGKR